MGTGPAWPAARGPQLFRSRTPGTDAGRNGLFGRDHPRADKVPELIRAWHARAWAAFADRRAAGETSVGGCDRRGGISASPRRTHRRCQRQAARMMYSRVRAGDAGVDGHVWLTLTVGSTSRTAASCASNPLRAFSTWLSELREGYEKAKFPQSVGSICRGGNRRVLLHCGCRCCFHRGASRRQTLGPYARGCQQQLLPASYDLEWRVISARGETQGLHHGTPQRVWAVVVPGVCEGR